MAGPQITKNPLVAPVGWRRTLDAILVRRQCWSLTFRGKLIFLAGLVVLFWAAIRFTHPFLAVTDHTRGPVLVVDGWVPTYTLKAVASDYTNGHYQQVLVVRGVYGWEEKYESGSHYTDYMARLLVRYGVPESLVDTVFCPVTEKDRTYHSALAIRRWLAEHSLSVDSLDLATVGPHARRSRLLYEKAFGPGMRIGVIALRDKAYDPAHWWRSSEGIREVPFEAIAYLYVRFFFHPAGTDSKNHSAPSQPTL